MWLGLTLTLVTLALSMGSTANAEDWAALLRQDVAISAGERLTRCEQRLVEAVVRGLHAWCGDGPRDPRTYDATGGRAWGEERTLRTTVIQAIAQSRAAPRIGAKGLGVGGARVVGKLDLVGLRLTFPLVIVMSYVEDTMDLSSAELPALVLAGSHTRGLVAEGLKVTGAADLSHGFRADGGIHLVSADIGRFLSFDGAILNNPKGAAIIADRLRVKDSVLFRGWDAPDGKKVMFAAEGEVRLINAAIQGDLNALGGTFRNPGDVALDAGGATIGGKVFLARDDRLQTSFTAHGRVVFLGAHIRGDVYLENARFERGSALILQRATINGALAWTDCAPPATVEHVTVDLRNAFVGTIADRQDCWPAKGNLHLDGFRYDSISVGPRDAATRLVWVRRQPVVIRHPYQQLARVLVNNGDPAGAREVLIELESDRQATEHIALRAWGWVLKTTTGYGYAAWRALYPALAIVTVGWIVLRRGFRSGLVTPSDQSAYQRFDESGRAPSYYPRFSPAIYSLDLFLPVITFGQKTHWTPNANRGALWVGGLTAGWFLRLYVWTHIALGWLLTTLVVAGVTGLLKSG